MINGMTEAQVIRHITERFIQEQRGTTDREIAVLMGTSPANVRKVLEWYKQDHIECFDSKGFVEGKLRFTRTYSPTKKWLAEIIGNLRQTIARAKETFNSL